MKTTLLTLIGLLGAASVSNAATISELFVRQSASAVELEFASEYAGASWGDYDGDGDLDLSVNGFNINILYTNDGFGVLRKRTDTPLTGFTGEAGTHSSTWIDYDNDGHLDLFFANLYKTNVLYRNLGSGEFRQMSRADAGPAAGDAIRVAPAASWADYNGDGFADLFIATGAFVGDQDDYLYKGGPGGIFTKVTNTVTETGQSDQGSWADYDNDGDQDLFVAHYADERNSLFRNDGDGKFVKITTGAIVTDRAKSVGASWGDYDNDGDLDLFVSNFYYNGRTQKNFFYRNEGDGGFTRINEGIIAIEAGHFISSTWVDADNDGWLDLFVTTWRQKNRLYRNLGNGSFERMTLGPLVNDLANSGGAAFGDYDNDGFQDVFIANGSLAGAQKNFLYKNSGNANHWLKLRLTGSPSNRSAVGARIRVKATIGGRDLWQMREVTVGHGWLTSGPLEQCIGLGDATRADLIQVRWPSGTVSEWTNVGADQILELLEPPRIDGAPVVAGQQVELKLINAIGLVFSVEGSSDLSTWTNLGKATNTMGRIQVTDTGAGANRFYRVAHSR